MNKKMRRVQINFCKNMCKFWWTVEDIIDNLTDCNNHFYASAYWENKLPLNPKFVEKMLKQMKEGKFIPLEEIDNYEDE